jgi:hypothetical protein
VSLSKPLIRHFHGRLSWLARTPADFFLADLANKRPVLPKKTGEIAQKPHYSRILRFLGLRLA